MYVVVLVALTKTTKRSTKDHKSAYVQQVRTAIDNHERLFLFSYENMRSNKFKDIRMHFRSNGKTSSNIKDMEEEEEDDDDDDGNFDVRLDRDEVGSGEPSRTGSINSYAALEQLSSRLKTAQVELESLRKSLRESQATRNSLVEELGETRLAKEKLPLFEAKVKELTDENRELELEIRGLRDDIADVREMYRTQLNVLLEEKAVTTPNISTTHPETSDEDGPTMDGADDTATTVQP